MPFPRPRFDADIDLDAALDVALDPATTATDLLRLPVANLGIWAAVSRRRRVPGPVRTLLFTTALESRWRRGGQREGESYEDFDLRWAVEIASARWLTRTRLAELVPSLADAASSAVSGDPSGYGYALVRALARHPKMDLELMGTFLERFSPGSAISQRRSPWPDVIAALRAQGHPWAHLADLADLYYGGDASHRYEKLQDVAAAVEGIDELSGRVLCGLLPSWRGSLRDAVASARDIGGNPDPANLAVDFGGYLDASTAPQAARFAEDPATSRPQLLLLPLDYLPIWTRVAARSDLDADLRARLVKAASSGPRVMRLGKASTSRRDQATTWAEGVLAPAWLTGHRLKLLGSLAAWHGADARTLVELLLAHPNVNADAITTVCGKLWNGVPHGDGQATVDTALDTIASGPAPWSGLADVMRTMRIPTRNFPYWWLDLNRWNRAGRRLDALRLERDHLGRLLTLLPTWEGDLASAVTQAAGPDVGSVVGASVNAV